MTDDVTTNKSLARHGADDIERTCHTGGQLKVLTHCNAGSLATVGYGTALGQLIDQSAPHLCQWCTQHFILVDINLTKF